MKPEEVRRLYDAGYAASYDAKFLTSERASPKTDAEIRLLEQLLKDRREWLDVACGTGFFLSRFAHIRRTGCDLSPAMLERARAVNPGIALALHDFREPRPEWNDRFDLVSCMWFAYILVDTVAQFDRLVENLAAWTSPEGSCFLPIARPRDICGIDIPYETATIFSGAVTITGILWSYADDNGAKLHAHLVTPQLEYITQQFRRHFEEVQIIHYQAKAGGGIMRYLRRRGADNSPVALVASRKKQR